MATHRFAMCGNAGLQARLSVELQDAANGHSAAAEELEIVRRQQEDRETKAQQWEETALRRAVKVHVRILKEYQEQCVWLAFPRIA